MSRFKQLKPKFKAPSKQVVRKNLSQDAMMIAARNKFRNPYLWEDWLTPS